MCMACKCDRLTIMSSSSLAAPSSAASVAVASSTSTPTRKPSVATLPLYYSLPMVILALLVLFLVVGLYIRQQVLHFRLHYHRPFLGKHEQDNLRIIWRRDSKTGEPRRCTESMIDRSSSIAKRRKISSRSQSSATADQSFTFATKSKTKALTQPTMMMKTTTTATSTMTTASASPNIVR